MTDYKQLLEDMSEQLNRIEEAVTDTQQENKKEVETNGKSEGVEHHPWEDTPLSKSAFLALTLVDKHGPLATADDMCEEYKQFGFSNNVMASPISPRLSELHGEYDYVERRKTGKCFEYWLTQEGQELMENINSKNLERYKYD